jgi:hypothetical protein
MFKMGPARARGIAGTCPTFVFAAAASEALNKGCLSALTRAPHSRNQQQHGP